MACPNCPNHSKHTNAGSLQPCYSSSSKRCALDADPMAAVLVEHPEQYWSSHCARQCTMPHPLPKLLTYDDTCPMLQCIVFKTTPPRMRISTTFRWLCRHPRPRHHTGAGAAWRMWMMTRTLSTTDMSTPQCHLLLVCFLEQQPTTTTPTTTSSNNKQLSNCCAGSSLAPRAPFWRFWGGQYWEDVGPVQPVVRCSTTGSGLRVNHGM